MMRLNTALALVTAAFLAAAPAVAQDGAGASRAAPAQPPPQPWTQEQMRAAQPAMPVLPGPPIKAAPGPPTPLQPPGPPEGLPGQAPQTEPRGR